MKKHTGLLVILASIISTTLVCGQVKNKDANKNSQTQLLSKTAADPVSTVMNINNITSWITADGFMPVAINGSWNGSFPKGKSAGVIYQEGIVWGGLVNDGANPAVRVSGNDYYSGTSHLTRIFRVRPDYNTADLTEDAANYFLVSVASVTSGQINQIKAQYAKDWTEWPASLGAPYEDVNHNGVYDSGVDIPGIPGASQTIWLSYDDSTSSNAYDSPPIGVKVNETLWAYAIANPLANVIYKKVDLIYTGTTNSAANSTINDMYIVQWADPDVGFSGDDFAGCDTTLGLGYAYNSTYNDAVYLAIGSAPPAVGYDFLQGVSQFTGNPADSAVRNLRWVHGYKSVDNKPLSTFIYTPPVSPFSDPAPQLYQGTLQWYSLMRGYQSYPYPFIYSYPTNDSALTVGGNGTYLVPGDPVTGTGWIDGQVETAGDRRLCNITGPFNLTLHDTAEIVVALVVGLGPDNLSSITVLKYNVGFATSKYFDLVNSLTDHTTGISNSGPSRLDFNLLQNYPNPFNPSTTIKYEIPKNSFVTIKVYDVLGRAVATLVNEEESAGQYSINFKAGSLSSGIYFYSVVAGSFHQTKKMVLVK